MTGASFLRPMSRCMSLCLLLCLGACGEDPELPPAQALTTDPQLLQQLYGAQTGPLGVVSARGLQLDERDGERALEFNLYYPDTGTGYPLLLFSHGNWSNKDSYDAVIEHWVSHGYAVIAPDHLDCCGAVSGILNSLRYGQLGLIEGRVHDMQRLLARLPEIEKLQPAFAGKSDPARLGLAGHSFGAFTAQQFGGAAALDPDTEKYQTYLDERVGAIVALSPPGPMFDTITAESWLQLSTPTLVTTGTWDIQPTFWPDWQMHLMSFETAVAGDKYALVTQGADHYMGNLICRLEREETPQDDALLMVRIVSTAFLDAYLKNDATARAFIDSDQLTELTEGFTVLSRR
ncbi:MAG: alpha/beta fold hydrolase [Pseudomonadales bacterium]|nr:alpha/beta fold hydrolase [Halioglobus sp.]MCP5131624.1 alpha/beta fold hydrolase [Pseudomonadales bacterium]